jgi:hypothetical protein
LSADYLALFIDQRRVMTAELLDDFNGSTNRGQWVSQLVSEHGKESVALLHFLVGLFQQAADLILALSCSERGMDCADKRKHPQWSFQKRQVDFGLKRFGELNAVPRGMSCTCEDEQWNFGPWRLISKRRLQTGHPIPTQTFFSDHGGADSEISLPA